MDKKTTKNKICILLGLLILATGLAISGKIGRSTTFAKYKTIIDSNSSTSTIARWDIRTIKKDKTEVSMLGEGLNYHKQVRMAIGFLQFIIYQM